MNGHINSLFVFAIGVHYMVTYSLLEPSVYRASEEVRNYFHSWLIMIVSFFVVGIIYCGSLTELLKTVYLMNNFIDDSFIRIA